MNMHWQEKWLLVAAAILAIIGSAGNWTLLPLAAAQVLLALLINTQDMQTPLRATSMIAQSAFLQVLITMAGSQIITRTFLFQLLFTTVPFIIAAWGSELPLPLTAILVVGVGVAGYFTQTLTLLVTLLIIIWRCYPYAFIAACRPGTGRVRSRLSASCCTSPSCTANFQPVHNVHAAWHLSTGDNF